MKNWVFISIGRKDAILTIHGDIMLRTIKIKEGEDGIEVDLFPNAETVPVLEKEATKNNADILVDVAKLGGEKGRTVPKTVYYHDGRGLDEVVDKTDFLFSKAYDDCPMCQRRAAEIKRKLGKIIESDSSEAEKRAAVRETLDRLKRESKMAKAIKPSPLAPGERRPLYDRYIENMGKAVDTVLDMPETFASTLGKLRFPWER